MRTAFHPKYFTMYIRSIAFAGLILGILFKSLHWPGANIVAFTSGALGIIILLFMLVRKPKSWAVQIHRPEMLIGSLVATLSGWQFKMMHWPGANMLLLVGLSVCALWFLLPPARTRTTAS